MATNVVFVLKSERRTGVSIPVPLECESSALPFELVPLVGLKINTRCSYQIIVFVGFPLKSAIMILGVISSILLRDLYACGLSSIPTPPIVELIEFFHAEAEMNHQPFPIS